MALILANKRDFDEQARKQLTVITSKKMKPALDSVVEVIIEEELPSGKSSPIAKDLVAEQVSETEFRIYSTNPVWSYLNYGTGIYSDRHKGKGIGGRIIPYNAKALHFKNAAIANALGFPDENVFLRSVKGIKPRFFFDKALTTSKFNEAFKGILKPSGKQPTPQSSGAKGVFQQAPKFYGKARKLFKKSKKEFKNALSARKRTQQRIRQWGRPTTKLTGIFKG